MQHLRDARRPLVRRSPAIANNFWFAINQVAQQGVQLNRTIAGQIAAKYECRLVLSSNVKSVRTAAGMLGITDGVSFGWPTPDYYVAYVNKNR